MDDKGKEPAASSSSSTTDAPTEPRKINIVQLAPWLVAATSKNKNFLLKPKDLQILYTLVLWQYISKHRNGGEPLSTPEAIENDTEIAIPEDELVRMVQVFYHNTYYPYFNRVSNM